MKKNVKGTLRVALVGNYPLDPDRIVGGLQAVFVYLLEGLKQIRGLDLYVVSAQKAVTQSTHLQREGVDFYFLPHPRLPFELAYPFLLRTTRQMLHRIKPDIVHAQSAPIQGAICIGAGYPTVATVHSLPNSENRFAPNWIDRIRLALHGKMTDKAFFDNARHIISISEYIRQGLDSRTRATFYHVDNPVSDAFFKLPSDQAARGRVLFVGFLRQVKRPDIALEALALARQQVPELHLQFAGAAIEPELYAKMCDFVAENHLDESVAFLGHLKEEQILKAYQEMSILLLTSELETSPMAVEQAMAAGKAVVATAVGGVPYLIEDGRTGILVEPNRPEQMAGALVRLARDHSLRRQIGMAARREALDRFEAKAVAAKICAAYHKVLNSER